MTTSPFGTAPGGWQRPVSLPADLAELHGPLTGVVRLTLGVYAFGQGPARRFEMSNEGQLGVGHGSAVEQIFQDASCAAGAFLATEIDIRRHARPTVPKLVCGISRRQSSLTHQSGHALSECVTAESGKASTSER